MSGRNGWTYALTLLTRRAYTKAQIEERLRKRDIGKASIDEVLARLEEYRLVDDEQYAQAYVESRRRRKGSLALRHELDLRGIDGELIEKAVGVVDEANELEAARRLLEANRWRFERGEPRTRRARAFAFLARRGFPAGVVAEAVAALAEEWQERAS